MAEPQPEIYKIFCILLGDDSPFPVEIASNETVADLKDKIKAKNENSLRTVDAKDLKLYYANLPIDDATEENVKQIMFQGPSPLGPATELSEVYASNPPKKMLHIIVQSPSVAATAANAPMQPLSQKTLFDSNLLFKATERGHRAFTAEILALNSIVHDTSRVSPFLDQPRRKLQAKRSMNDKQRESLKYNAPTLDLNPYFKSAEGDADCSSQEIAQYGSLFFIQPPSLSVSVGIVSYRYIGAFLCQSYSKPKFSSEGNWPFSLVATVDGANFSYTPRSDFLLLLNDCPFLLIEVCSDRQHELDRNRLLLQAGILVRVMNSLKRNREGEFKSFIAVAIYVNAKSTAERYLVGQPAAQQAEIMYVKDEFDLTTPTGGFRFLFELHNLPSALPCDDQLSSVADKLHTLSQEVKNARIEHFTSKSTKKRKTTESESGNLNAPPEESPWGGSSSLTHGLSKLGIQLDNEEEFPGWTILNPLPPNLHRGRTLDGNSVVLKLVEARELAIHSFLNSVKSRDNHTVPILQEVVLGTKAIIVMPDELVLPYVANSVFETSGNDLASQFLAGVRFMHQQNVAHLDLKPDNILVTPTTIPLLRICDYDVSARVAGPESWITGYQGTPGWTAPEITKDPNTWYQPIRADLWSAGRVTEYIAHRQPAHISYVFTALSKSLLNRDPVKRPLLSEICLPHEEEQPQLKRKPSVVEGGVERRHIHADSQHSGED